METRDLAKLQVDEVGKLRPVLEEWMRRVGGLGDRPDENQAQSEETLRALKALGYLD